MEDIRYYFKLSMLIRQKLIPYNGMKLH